jgi:HSP20 family molecular chaperone IbpA
MKETNTFAQKRIETQRSQNDQTLNNEVERGKIAQERLRTNQEKQLTDVRERGESKIAISQEQNEKKLTRSNTEAESRYEKQQQQWDSKEKNLNTQYSQRVMQNKKAYEKELKTQNEHFQSTYQKNNAANRESLDIQEDMYTKELANTRQQFVKEAGKYSAKEKDPFYKVENRGSVLHETPNFYVLRAFVPEHEKDNVRVTIQNDKAMVSGQRSFKDNIADDTKKVSSSSYQTFREEFAFEKPIISEGMTREREGDFVVYTIPKGMATGFSRKA